MKNSIAFAGFRHGHIFSLYESVRKRGDLILRGAWEVDPQARADAREKNVVFNYDSVEAILQDDTVDIIAIGDYYGARGELAIRALKAGKHIIADKPLCTRLEEWLQIRELSEKNDLAVGIMLDLRDNGAVLAAKCAIENGLVGNVNNITFEGQHPLLYGIRPGWYFEKGKHGGVINDIAIHGIDLVRQFTKSDVEDVLAARCWNFYAADDPDFLDSAQFMLKMGNGAGVIADVSYAAPSTQGYSHPAYWHFRIWGEKGLLDFRAGSREVYAYLNGDREPKHLPALMPAQTYLDDFLHAVCHRDYRQLYRQENLASTGQTLMIQEKAGADL